LYSSLLVNQGVKTDEKSQILGELLKKFGRDETDFILFFGDDIALSQREEVPRGFFSKGKARQIFIIPETDTTCYTRKASVVHENVLMPHSVYQELTPAVKALVPELDRCKILTYDTRGEVHGI
jgi:hypothetical protein